MAIEPLIGGYLDPHSDFQSDIRRKNNKPAHSGSSKRVPKSEPSNNKTKVQKSNQTRRHVVSVPTQPSFRLSEKHDEPVPYHIHQMFGKRRPINVDDTNLTSDEFLGEA